MSADGGVAQAGPASELGRAAVDLLRELLRANTVNPPGDERAVQESLAARLDDAGFECELIGAEPERPNLIARLRGPAEGPTLTLLGHVDTVRADAAEWSRDPWSGELVDGWVWGRGALDMKGQVASEVAAACELASSGWRPAAGELMVVLTCDEEAGGDLGARWLCEEHPEKVRTDLVLNEGGGTGFELGERTLYPISVGEKGIFRARITTRGRAGHASVPALGDNALLKLAPLIARLGEQPPPEPAEAGLDFLAAALGEEVSADDAGAALERLERISPPIAAFLAGPMLGVTLSPTRVSASEKVNVIPSSAELTVDCRVPPGMGEEPVRERIAGLLGADGYELRFSEAVTGNASPFRSDLSTAIGRWVDRVHPGAELVPVVMPGFSDSHWFRRSFDSALVYGFCPHRRISLFEAAPLIHSADERVPAEDIELAAHFFSDIAREVLGDG